MKFVNLDAKRDIVTTKVVNTSPNASVPEAINADELIFFPSLILNLLSQILDIIEIDNNIKGIHWNTTVLGWIILSTEVLINWNPTNITKVATIEAEIYSNRPCP